MVILFVLAPQNNTAGRYRVDGEAGRNRVKGFPKQSAHRNFDYNNYLMKMNNKISVRYR